MIFLLEELYLMHLFDYSTKAHLLKELGNALSEISDTALIDLTTALIGQLRSLPEEDFTILQSRLDMIHSQSVLTDGGAAIE